MQINHTVTGNNCARNGRQKRIKKTQAGSDGEFKHRILTFQYTNKRIREQISIPIEICLTATASNLKAHQAIAKAKVQKRI
jgi:hypothetical protein